MEMIEQTSSGPGRYHPHPRVWLGAIGLFTVLQSLTLASFAAAPGVDSTDAPKPASSSGLAVVATDEMLMECGFLRVHQSHLLNLNEVVGYEGGDHAEAILSDGQRMPVSRRKKTEFEEAIRRMAR